MATCPLGARARNARRRKSLISGDSRVLVPRPCHLRELRPRSISNPSSILSGEEISSTRAECSSWSLLSERSM
ncbi:MAG: hypothetical protein MUE65_04455, partial [Methanomassiliicoccales archaeon]|nr:hypothetical protein [Methanomassiliicoccales archaeon]